VASPFIALRSANAAKLLRCERRHCRAYLNARFSRVGRQLIEQRRKRDL
jgi:hypothetical protein